MSFWVLRVAAGCFFCWSDAVLAGALGLPRAIFEGSLDNGPLPVGFIPWDGRFLNWLELARFRLAATACIAAPSTDFPINFGLRIVVGLRILLVGTPAKEGAFSTASVSGKGGTLGLAIVSF